MKKYIALFLLISCWGSCTKFVQIDPPTTSLVNTNVYSSNASASSVLIGLYNTMMNSSGNFPGAFDQYAGLQADELTNYSNAATQVQFYKNALVSTNVSFWSELYNYIFVANSAIEGINQSSGLTSAVRAQLLGEAKFCRAFFYFYLVNNWGDVPLITSAAEYSSNASSSRTAKTDIYTRIVSDLKDAQNSLSADFLGGDAQTTTTERTRPTKWAATALLARVYLYLGRWADAESQASMVIGQNQFNLVGLDSVFLKNSQESIWQLQPVSAGYNTYQAPVYILLNTPGTNPNYYSISPFLQAAFEKGDARDSAWMGRYISSTNDTFYYPYKYKVNQNASDVSEYLTVFRLAEQYLIRAEAEAHGAGSGLSAGIADLNVIRNRASLPSLENLTSDSLLTAILHERQVELFTEWGHRWLDLKRTGTVDAVMGTGGVCQYKGGTWSPNWALDPLPLSDLQTDARLTQNPGYE